MNIFRVLQSIIEEERKTSYYPDGVTMFYFLKPVRILTTIQIVINHIERLNEHVIDYDLLEDLVIHVDKTFDEGAILVFLPGVSEIHLLYDRLAASYQFGGQASDWILPLHSSIASTDQKKVFLRPPYGIRKASFVTYRGYF
ncbi:DExH-box ATP-dependent RNA helicase DExH7 [Cucumis melo var. makuwa]|uniref:DExH-box ATP-dependent RNA helicase DExH7 n=1 Tax=Cucumis melo var. makuwa TaxID=1194695 RepID=A0A5D3CGV2_CUCMM|nr:DExH-box ATP-dependent RNA helicase DExH7 [Cucumis melo var. makuwa]